MRALLISPNREEINMRSWPLGLACVAAAAEAAGHEVRVLDLISEPDPFAALAEAYRLFRPQVVGISVRNIDDQRMDSPVFMLDEVGTVVSRCKEFSDAPVILGGAGYSMFPEAALHYLGADMGIQGEGEAAFVRLLEHLERGEDVSTIPGVFVTGSTARAERSFVHDLDSFPLPGPQILAPSGRLDPDFRLPVQTRRGCPMKCSYCSTATIEGPLLRKRSPAAVIRWLEQWVKEGFRRYYFVDNTFNLPPSYAKELCSRISEACLGIEWRCILYPRGMDEELAKAMAQAGCKEVSLGFESGADEILYGMNKKFTAGDVRRHSRLLADHGIGRMGFLLLGGPGETKQTASASLEFADSLHLDMVKINIGIRIYPYTRLAETAVAQGVVSADDDLLQPRFYIVPGLEDWLRKTVNEWMKQRPNWIR